MMIIEKRPRLSAQANWGFDNTVLHDARKFRKYTILRVFERGTSQDISELFDCYGENVKKTLLHAGQLSPRVMKTAEAIWPNFREMHRPRVTTVGHETAGTPRSKTRVWLSRSGRSRKIAARRSRAQA